MARMTKSNKVMMWGASGVAAAMLALTAYAAFSGDDAEADKSGGKDGSPSASSKPTPGYSAPDEWTEPGKWASLPRGKRTDGNGNTVGFPHTTTGAVALLSAANSTAAEGDRDLVDEQLGVFDSYLAEADQTADNKAKIKTQATQNDAALRRKLGIPATGDMPSGAYVRTHTVGFKIIKESKDEVGVYLLARVTSKAGELEKETSSYTRTLLGAEWDGKDWKMSTAATTRVAQQAQGEGKPAMAAPGDKAFNRAGWTAIREAS